MIDIAKCVECGNKIERNQFKVYKKRLICLKCYKAIKAEQKRQRVIAKGLKELKEKEAEDMATARAGHSVNNSACTL